MQLSNAAKAIRLSWNKAARRSKTYDQLTDTRGILAMGVAPSGWNRHSRMVGRDSVGRYRLLSMAFGLEDLFEGIIANGK
jgi:hypothetical protein